MSKSAINGIMYGVIAMALFELGKKYVPGLNDLLK